MDRDQLVLDNLPLARRMAGNWLGKIPGYEGDDLEQECLIAMLDAAQTWDELRVKFSTFAWHCMEKHLCRLWQRGGLIPTPRYLASLVELARRSIQRGTDPAAAIAELQTTPARRELVALALRARRPFGRLDEDRR